MSRKSEEERARGGAETQMVEISGNKGEEGLGGGSTEKVFFEDDDGETRKVGSTWWSSGPVVVLVPSGGGGGVDARCNRCFWLRDRERELLSLACNLFGCSCCIWNTCGASALHPERRTSSMKNIEDWGGAFQNAYLLNPSGARGGCNDLDLPLTL